MENKYEEVIKNLNVLLVDDDDDYMMMTYSFLTQIGYNIDRASNGKEAIEMLKTNKYQIALLDYYMPDYTGEKVINEIRKTNKELIIILQTGFSGHKPPIETLKSLGIQNYFDKTEGIDRLNLELISAVKIFCQQNEIELSKFKSYSIGKLIAGVAQEIKDNLLSIGAGIEITNMSVNDNNIDTNTIANLNKYYRNNKESLERIDKVLTSIINQSTENTEYVLSDVDVIELLEIITKNKAKSKNINLKIKSALKNQGYIKGSINDSVFIVAEILESLMNLEDEGSLINVIFTDDESKWYFKVSSEDIGLLPNSKISLLEKVASAMNKTKLYKEEDNIILSIGK